MKKISTHTITFKYVVALGLLAVLSIASYYVLQENIKAQETSAAVINTSGRQRMLSQRIALKAHHLVNTLNKTNRTILRTELSDMINLMKQSHDGLKNGSPPLNLPGKPSRQVRGILFSSPILLDSQVKNYLKEAEALVNAKEPELTPDNVHLNNINKVSGLLLMSLDAIVKQYQKESETAISRLQTIETIILIAALSLLILLALFIFRPMVKRIEHETGEIERAEEYSRTIMEMAADGMIIINEEGIIQSFNRSAEKMFGYPSSQVIGENVNILMPEPHHSSHDSYLVKYLKDPSGQSRPVFAREITGLRKDRTTVPLSLTVSEMIHDNRRLFISILRDITEQQKMEEKLKAAAITDELTGLLNRRGFMTLSGQQHSIAKRKMRKMSLIYIDLNNMKTINDMLGHHAGDLALIDTADILRMSFRVSDIMARLGGDEFAVLLTEHSESDIEEIILNNIKSNLKTQNEQGGRSYDLSFSMGICHFDPHHPCSIDELLSRADELMYLDKKNKVDSRR